MKSSQINKQSRYHHIPPAVGLRISIEYYIEASAQEQRMDHPANNSHSQSSSNLMASLSLGQENFLTRRLYKNYSQLRLERNFRNSESQDVSHQFAESRLRQPASLLMEFAKKGSEESVLVPKITNRLKTLDSSKATRLQIDKGKFMLSPSPSVPSLNTSVLTTNRRNLFNKLEALDFPLPILSYDDSSMMVEPKVEGVEVCSSTARLKERFKKHKKKTSKNSTKITSYECHDNNADDPDESLTPYDFIKLVSEDPSISDEFCYLKKMSNPYDLKIVDYDILTGEDNAKSKQEISSARHRSEHNIFNKKPVLQSKSQCITISSRGITYFTKDESVFVPLDEWQREAALYHRLSRLNFFKDYKLWKNFLAWKKYLRRTAMKKVSQKLRCSLLLADNQLRLTLLKAREETIKIENEIKYFKIEESEKELPSAEQLKFEQDSYRSNELEQNLTSIEHAVKALVVDACRHSLTQFKEEQKREMESRFKGDPKSGYEEQSKLDHRYTDEATCKTHYKKLHKFVKLVDYMVITGKLGMILESTSHLGMRIGDKNSDYYREVIKTNEKYGYKGKQWFVCELFFDEVTHQLIFEPNRQRLRSIFEQIINKGVTRVCKKHRMIADSPELRTFRIEQEEPQDHAQQTFDMQSLLQSNDQFRNESKQLLTEVETSFDYVERYSKRLYEFLEIYFNNTTEDMNNYYRKDHNSIRKSIARWKQQNNKLNGIIEEHEAGMTLISTMKLKQKIKNSAQERLQTLYRMLPGMLTSQTQQITELMVQYRQEIKTKPKNVRQFIRFDENVKIIDGQLDELSARISEISFLSAIIKQNRNAIGEPAQSLKSKENRVAQAQKLLTGLRNIIHQANMDFSKTQADFREQVRKMVPVLVKRVESLHQDILQFNLNNPEREQQQNVEFLEKCKCDLTIIFEESQQIAVFEKSLDMQLTEQLQLSSFSAYFNNLYELWTLIQNFTGFQETVNNKQFLNVNIVEDETQFGKLIDRLGEVVKCLASSNGSYAFDQNDETTLQQFHDQLSNYQPVMLMLRHLNDPTLKEKEWLEIREQLSQNIGEDSFLLHREDPLYTVKALTEKKIHESCEFFESICIKAKIQQELANTLKKVTSFWSTTSIAYEPFKDFKDVYLLLPNDELYSRIEQCRMQLQLVYQSKYAQCVQAEADKQLRLFGMLEDLLSEWFRHQKNWLYLEPLFCNSYFKGFLKELKLFTTADNSWRKIMKVSKEFSTKKWAQSDNAMATLRANNATFETLKKMVPDLLERKREVFSRFYMLSDSELIKLLSGYKDVKSVQPYLAAIFGSVQSFDFNPTDKDIQRSDIPTAVISCDNEILTLKGFRPGIEAEECLKNLEQSMKTGLKSAVKLCVNAFEKDSFQRKKWIRQHLSQAIVLGELYQFTKLVETDYLPSAAGQEMEYDLSELLMLQFLQLSETAELMQESPAPVSRKLLYSLIIQSLANRDCVDMLRRENVQSVTDYKWQQELKVSYINETFVVRSFQMEIPYGYEFLGINERPVSTPQTERARLQVLSNIAQGRGFISSDSSEVVKDLAYISGRTVNVFNPVHSDSRTVLNIVKGACATGSWVAFNNMSYLQEDTLRDICGWIDVVRLAILNKDTMCTIEDTPITLAKDFTVFNLQGNDKVSSHISNRFRSTGPIQVDRNIVLLLNLQKYGLLDTAEDLSKDLAELIVGCNEYFSTEDCTFTTDDAIKVVGSSSLPYKKLDESIIVQGLVQELLKAMAQRYRISDKLLTRTFEQVLPSRYLPAGTSQAASVNSHPPTKQSQLPKNLERRVSIVELERKPNDLAGLLRQSNRVWVEVDHIWNSQVLIDELSVGKASMVLPAGLCSDDRVLLGHKTEQLLWENGILTAFLKAQQGRSKLVVLENPPLRISEYLCDALDNKYMCLADGNKLEFGDQLRILFVVSSKHLLQQPIGTLTPIQIEQTGPVTIQSSFKQYFGQPQNQGGLSIDQIEYLIRLHLQNSQLLLAAASKYLQGIAIQDHSVLLSCCRNIRGLLLACEQPLPPINDRGLEKLYAWAMFSAVYCLLDSKAPLDKLAKSFADVIRLEHIKVSNLFEHELSFAVPEGVFKPVSWDMAAIPKQLSAHIAFLKLHMKVSQPLIIMGKSGSLKSETLNIMSSLDPQEKSIVMRVTPHITLSEFISTLQGKLCIRKTSNGTYEYQSGKVADERLSIFVDDANFNPDIVDFVVRLTITRQLWNQELSVLATLCSNISIHLVFNGKASFDKSILNCPTHLPVTFNESPSELLMGCYSVLLASSIEENQLKELLDSTNQIIEHVYPLLNGHDLSKLYRAIMRYQPPTRQAWCLELANTISSHKSYADDITVLQSVCRIFKIKVGSLPPRRINANLIRVHPSRQKWDLKDLQTLTDKRCLSLQVPDDWQSVVGNDETAGCVHLVGHSPNIVQNVKHIQNLLYSSADSQTKCRTIFVVDMDQPTYDRLYGEFSSCIDRYFRISYSPSPKEEDIRSKVRKVVGDDSLADKLQQVIQMVRGYLPVEEETIDNILSEYQSIKAKQESSLTGRIQTLETCLQRFEQLREKKRLLSLEMEQNKSSHEAQLTSQASYLAKSKIDAVSLNSVKRQYADRKQRLAEKLEEVRTLRGQDKNEEADGLERLSKGLEQEVAKLKQSMDSQSKAVLASEQQAQECKKTEQHLMTTQKSLEEKDQFLSRTLEMADFYQQEWQLSREKMHKYKNTELASVCLRAAASIHMLKLADTAAVRSALIETLTAELPNSTEELKSMEIQPGRVVRIAGGRLQAKSWLLHLLLNGHRACALSQGSEFQQGSMLVAAEEDLDGRDFSEHLNEFGKVYVIGGTGIVLPRMESCSMLQKTIMQVMVPELYMTYTSNVLTQVECRISLAKRKLEVMQAMTLSNRCLQEDKECVAAMDKCIAESAITSQHIAIAQENIQQALAGFNSRYAKLCSVLKEFYETTCTLAKLDSNYAVSDQVFCCMCRLILSEAMPVPAVQPTEQQDAQPEFDTKSLCRELRCLVLQGIRSEHKLLAMLWYRLKEDNIPNWLQQYMLSPPQGKPTREQFEESLASILLLEGASDFLPNIAKTAPSELLLYPGSSELKPVERVLMAVLLRSQALSAELSAYLCEQQLPSKKCLSVAGVASTVIEASNPLDRESAILRIYKQAKSANIAQLKWLPLGSQQTSLEDTSEEVWFIAQASTPSESARIQLLIERLRSSNNKVKLFLLVPSLRVCSNEMLSHSLRLCQGSSAHVSRPSQAVKRYYEALQAEYSEYTPIQRMLSLAGSFFSGILLRHLTWLPINCDQLIRTIQAAIRQHPGQDWHAIADIATLHSLTYLTHTATPAHRILRYLIQCVFQPASFVAILANCCSLFLEELIKLNYEQLNQQLASSLPLSIQIGELGVPQDCVDQLIQQQSNEVYQCLGTLEKKLPTLPQPSNSLQTDVIAECLDQLPQGIAAQRIIVSYESIEKTLVQELSLLNQAILLFRTSLFEIKERVKNGILLPAEDRTILTYLNSGVVPALLVPPSCSHFPTQLHQYIGFLNRQAQYFASMAASKFKLRHYPLGHFFRPARVLNRLVQLEKKRLKITTGQVYLRLVSNQHEGANDTATYLTDMLMEGCCYDPIKMCLDELASQEMVAAPTVQLMVGDTLPLNVIYATMPIIAAQPDKRVQLINVLVSIRKKNEDSWEREMALVVSYLPTNQ